jgi:zinc transporter ZupT
VAWALIAGLSVHAVLDGAALAMPKRGLALALAVLVHRLPIGLVVGNLFDRRQAIWMPLVAALAISGATVLGYVAGAAALEPVGHKGLALFEALVAGTLLHVVTHHGPELFHRRERPQFVAGAVGALLGLASVVALITLHPSH